MQKACALTAPRSVVITGASRGLGLASAAHLYKLGWRVVAAMRSVDTGLERLLGVSDVGDCIDHALAWLVAHTHATQAICLLADADTNQLRGVAGNRVPAAHVEEPGASRGPRMGGREPVDERRLACRRQTAACDEA